ncbi:MAG: hypothetical protein NUV97_00105 [archaeon]|nr:hypothetical protein [archaeon]MCR4323581.1 hypothetical protein [Nanoarchaeota archaeon]
MVMRHNCGFCVAHTLHDVYSFIKSLQHRGREATGIAFIGDKRIDVIKWSGEVGRFDIKDLYTLFPSEDYHTYMAHVRYATRGRKDKILQDAHPQVIGGTLEDRGKHVIITNCDAVMVHNGQVEEEYLSDINKEILTTDCDTERLLHKYNKMGEKGLLSSIPGAYTLAVARKGEGVVVLRDQSGIKPGALGWKDGKYIVASEDVAFKKNGGLFIDDLKPGYSYYLHPQGNYSKKKIIENKTKHCFFEWNYIADVGSILEGVSVRRVREVLGEQLAKEFPLEVDFVTFLPRCPEVAARKYAEEIKAEFIDIFYKTRSERSFLGSTTEERKESISSNLFLLPGINGRNIKESLRGKTIAIVDDSTVRGNNSKKAIELLKKEVDVKKIYFINYTPKIGIVPSDGVPRGCSYGVDMPPTDNFISRKKTDEEISEEIGAEVKFLSVEGMLKGFEKLGISREKLCYFCIGGKRPF